MAKTTSSTVPSQRCERPPGVCHSYLGHMAQCLGHNVLFSRKPEGPFIRMKITLKEERDTFVMDVRRGRGELATGPRATGLSMAGQLSDRDDGNKDKLVIPKKICPVEGEAFGSNQEGA